jgi:hypothetical protein
MKPKMYASPQAFRAAIESRFIQISKKENIDIMRLRRQFTFDRFLCRVFHGEKDTIMLKGGYAMELRIAAARTTRDIDLCMKKGKGHTPSHDELHTFFQNKAALEMGDFFDFTVLPHSLELVTAPYGGLRFPVEASMAYRQFLKFSVDVAVGDVWLVDGENLHSRNWLEFAGISPSDFPSITIEQQLAEKIHSYTLPRQTPNSRVKDLVDIVLLTRNFKINKERMRDSLKQTFKIRKTQFIPNELSQPPESWITVFTKLSKECELEMDLAGAFAHLKEFYENITK